MERATNCIPVSESTKYKQEDHVKAINIRRRYAFHNCSVAVSHLSSFNASAFTRLSPKAVGLCAHIRQDVTINFLCRRSLTILNFVVLRKET